MKWAIVTTITKPEENQYAWREALNCYREIADEVVVVCGHLSDIELLANYMNWQGWEEGTTEFETLDNDKKFKAIYLNWPEEWDWSELPKHINKGFENVSSDIDWACKMDIDYFFNEKGIVELKEKLVLATQNGYKTCEVLKTNVVNKDKCYPKCIVEIFINMHYWKDLYFGKAIDKETDWCFPIWRATNKALSPRETMMIGVYVYNYDSFFRTKDVQQKVFWRFSKAYQRVFNKWKFGSSPDDALKKFIDMAGTRARFSILQKIEHPKWLKARIDKMTPEQFGYNNWGLTK